jgi:hypothetical protein
MSLNFKKIPKENFCKSRNQALEPLFYQPSENLKILFYSYLWKEAVYEPHVFIKIKDIFNSYLLTTSQKISMVSMPSYALLKIDQLQAFRHSREVSRSRFWVLDLVMLTFFYQIYIGYACPNSPPCELFMIFRK